MVQLLHGCYDYNSPDTILHLLSKHPVGLQTPPDLSNSTILSGGSEVLDRLLMIFSFRDSITQIHKIFPIIIIKTRKILRILASGLLLATDYMISF